MELHFPNNFTQWTEQEQKSYQDGKEKVLFQHLYPGLEWNTLLRLRLVCKGTKKLVDKYLRDGEGIKRCPQITIQERSECEERSIRAYLAMSLRTTSIYLRNISGSAYFTREKADLEEFCRSSKVIKKITHLRVFNLNQYPRGVEQRFYESLVKLESLEANEFGEYSLTQEESTRTRSTTMSKKVEDMYKRLKKLTLRVRMRHDIMQMNLFIASNGLMDMCPNLEFAGDAFSSHIDMGEGDEDLMIVLGVVAFAMIKKRVDKRYSKLKGYDFAGFHQDRVAQTKEVCFFNSKHFAKLLMACHKRGVKLYNVNAGWFSGQFKWIEVNTHVISMMNLHGNAVARVVNEKTGETTPVPLSNLVKLVIPATSQSCLFPRAVNRMVMPKLRVLEVTVDSQLLDSMVKDYHHCTGQLNCRDPETTENLFKWLFMDIPRPSLEELKLKFVDGVRLTSKTQNAVDHLGTCCPNLKKLVLVNWPGRGELLKKALSELRYLEELTLDRCKLLCDDTFEVSSMQNLKKLSLLHREQMPGITEALLKDVLPQLQQLKLTDLKK